MFQFKTFFEAGLTFISRCCRRRRTLLARLLARCSSCTAHGPGENCALRNRLLIGWYADAMILRICFHIVQYVCCG